MKKLKNIIIVNDTANVIGGAAKVAIDNAVDLAAEGFNVVFFTSGGLPEERLAASRAEIVSLNSPLFLDDSSRIRGALRGLWFAESKNALSKLLEGYSPEDTIVHVHSWTKGLSSSVFSSIKQSRIPAFLTVHDYFLSCPNGGFYDFVSKEACTRHPLSPECLRCNCDRRSYAQKIYRCMRTFIQRKALRSCNLNLLYLSQFSRDILASSIPKSFSGKMFWNEVSVAHCLEHPALNTERRAVYVGRLDEEKGVDLFCDAVSSSDYEGIVCGSGYQLEFLKERYPAIVFKGWCDQDEIFAVLSQASVAVFPSRWYEVSPLTIPEIQKMAFLPVITADACAGREQIVEGTTGLTFVSGDSHSLLEKLNSLTDARINEMKRAVEESVKHISRPAYVEALTSLYESGRVDG